jgi:hypothetical protein
MLPSRLQQLATIDLVERKNDSALYKVREAFFLLEQKGERYYLQPGTFLEQIYSTTADVHRALGNTDQLLCL